MKKIVVVFCFAFISIYTYSQCGVVINEVMYGPDAVNSTLNNSVLYKPGPSNNREWIELYNGSSCDTVDISCWIIGSNLYTGSSENVGLFHFPKGTKIAPLDFIVVGGKGATYKDFDLSQQDTLGYYCGSSRWFLDNVDGWVALYDSTGNPMDALYWAQSGNASDLSTSLAFSNKIVDTCKCAASSLDTLAAAKDISPSVIEFAGQSIGNDISPPIIPGEGFMRTYDGSITWINELYSAATPGACNAGCRLPLSATIAPTAMVCGDTIGAAVVTATDGSPGYAYSWSNGDTLATASNLITGLTYSVTITDTCSCTFTQTITLTQQNALQINAVTNSNSDCGQANGIAMVNVLSGTPTYNYVWGTNPTQSTATATGLTAGTYTVLVTDLNNCSSIDTVTITTYTINAISSTNPVTCHGGSNGMGGITNVLLATSPITYSWSPNTASSAILTGLSAGVYTIYVTDNKGCKDTVSILIDEPIAISLFADSIQNPTCTGFADGYIDVTAYGGTGNITYSWTPTSATTQVITNLGLGSYSVTVTDFNSCTYDSVFTLTEPALPDSVNIVTPYCVSNESLTLFASKGYQSYQWYDANGNLISGATSDSLVISNPTLGSIYSVYINPGIGKCAYIDSLIITEEYHADTDKLTHAPNVFTPNADGYNDLFDLTVYNIEDIELEVYNRWGTKVYSGAGTNAIWDGKIDGKQANEGVYYWIAKYKNVCVSNGKQFIYKGFVQVMD